MIYGLLSSLLYKLLANHGWSQWLVNGNWSRSACLEEKYLKNFKELRNLDLRNIEYLVVYELIYSSCSIFIARDRYYTYVSVLYVY